MRRALSAAVTTLALVTATALGPAAAAVGADPGTPHQPATSAAPTTRPTGLPIRAAGPVERAKVAPGLQRADGTVTAFVELAAPSALDVAESGGDRAAVDAASVRIESLADAVVPQQPGTRPGTDPAAAPQQLSVTTNLVAGTVVRGDAEQLRALAASPDVVAVHRVVAKTVDSAGTAAFTRALDAWQATGGTGAGVRVGVVDTGVDYTHATFGGAGTAQAYADAYGADGTGPVPPGAVDPVKYLGGRDFAGPRYDAEEAVDGTTAVPQPDDNPLDPRGGVDAGHGTHVAGTAFGLGVDADGRTFRGDHARLTDVSGWRVAPGAAPRAGIYALKVFGDGGGATELTIDALDWAADPDGDGDFGDRLDVLTLAIGADGAPADDPENLFVDRLSDLGVLSVFSGGNAGDVTDVGGVPSSARSALTVAWSVGDTQSVDGVRVTAARDRSAVGTHAAQHSLAYAGGDVTAPVVHLGEHVDGCSPLTEHAAAVTGKIVWLWWDDDAAPPRCGTAVRWTHAEQAGAVGVLMGTDRPRFAVPVRGTETLPGAQLTADATRRLLPLIEAGGVVAQLGPSLRGTAVLRDEALADTLEGASSRGVHGSLGVVKPDVAAPGTRISSAAVGTGTRSVVFSGSSMAAAHVAGVAALVRAAHPGWTPAQVKAAVMNTATHDVHPGPDRSGPVFGPARVGAGRVDALDAVRATVLAHAADDPALVSVGFGVVPVGAEPVVRRQAVTVQNTGTAVVTYRTAFDAATTAGGATVTASPATLVVPPGQSRLVTLTLTADPATLRKDLDPTSADTHADLPRDFVAEVSGRLVLRGDAGDLRVPVRAAPRLVSDLAAAGVDLPAPGASSAPLHLTGRAVDGGGWTSLVAPLQLVATSPRLEAPTGATSASSVDSGDLRYVGFASTAPQLAAAGGDPADGWVGIGIATQGEWASLGTMVQPVVDVDVDGDEVADVRTVVAKEAAGVDVTTATTYDLATGDAVGWAPVNGLFGDVDTTVFDSDVAVVPISLRALGVRPGQTPTFTVWTWAPDYAPDTGGVLDPGVLDRAEPFTLDPYAPEYWFDDGGSESLLFVAAPGAPLTVHRTAAPGTTPTPLLLLHTHNSAPTRAQVVDVAAPVATPTTTTLRVTGDPVVGTELSLTATVAPATAGGTVTFHDGGTRLAAAPVVAGSATASVRLGAGAHRLTATFDPDSPQWSPSTSGAADVAVAQGTSSVSLRLTRRALGFGDSTRAVVQVTGRGAAPSGVVDIHAGDRLLASADLVTDGPGGTAVVDLPRDLPVGAHRLTAVYRGSTDLAGSASAPVRVRVDAASPRLTLDAPAWTVEPDSTPTLTVTVAGPPGAPPPTGRVTVLVNLRRTATVDLGPDGTVEVTLPAMRRGSLVTAVYGGDAGYRPALRMRTVQVR